MIEIRFRFSSITGRWCVGEPIQIGRLAHARCAAEQEIALLSHATIRSHVSDLVVEFSQIGRHDEEQIWQPPALLLLGQPDELAHEILLQRLVALRTTDQIGADLQRFFDQVHVQAPPQPSDLKALRATNVRLGIQLVEPLQETSIFSEPLGMPCDELIQPLCHVQGGMSDERFRFLGSCYADIHRDQVRLHGILFCD